MLNVKLSAKQIARIATTGAAFGALTALNFACSQNAPQYSAKIPEARQNSNAPTYLRNSIASKTASVARPAAQNVARNAPTSGESLLDRARELLAPSQPVTPETFAKQARAMLGKNQPESSIAVQNRARALLGLNPLPDDSAPAEPTTVAAREAAPAHSLTVAAREAAPTWHSNVSERETAPTTVRALRKHERKNTALVARTGKTDEEIPPPLDENGFPVDNGATPPSLAKVAGANSLIDVDPSARRDSAKASYNAATGHALSDLGNAEFPDLQAINEASGNDGAAPGAGETAEPYRPRGHAANATDVAGAGRLQTEHGYGDVPVMQLPNGFNSRRKSSTSNTDSDLTDTRSVTDTVKAAQEAMAKIPMKKLPRLAAVVGKWHCLSSDCSQDHVQVSKDFRTVTAERVLDFDGNSCLVRTEGQLIYQDQKDVRPGEYEIEDQPTDRNAIRATMVSSSIELIESRRNSANCAEIVALFNRGDRRMMSRLDSFVISGDADQTLIFQGKTYAKN